MVILKEKEIGDTEENIGAVGQGGYHRIAPWLWGNVEEEFSKWARSLASGDTRCLQNMCQCTGR